MDIENILLKISYWLILLASKCAPWAGLILGFSVLALFHADKEKKKIQQFLFSVVIITALVGPLAWFFLPNLLNWLAYLNIVMPRWHLFSHIFGFIAGCSTYIFWGRWFQPYLNQLSHKLTRRTALERNRRTDVRDISKHLPGEGKKYDPLKYMEKDPSKGKGVFLGLDERNSPIYVPYEKWLKSHVQIIGTTGIGKGIASALMLSQALRAGESVFVLDPKDDEWAPHVLSAEAERAGVPFYLINLAKEVPQLDLLAGLSTGQLEELFISGFSLAEKGEAADFYRTSDRRAARQTSFLLKEVDDLRSLFLDEGTQSLQEKVPGFFGKLEELSLLTAINAPGGLDLSEVVRNGGCVYIIGSMRHSRLIMAQRMLFIRLLQLAEERDRVIDSPRPICVFLDELKYHISRAALEGLGAARDKGMHLILANQSVADLYDCPADLKPEAVVGAVVENCSIRLAYQLQNPETAKWLAQMSGEILVDDEIRRVDRNSGGAELMHHGRTVRQATRQFVDVNMLRNMPPRTAVLFGVGLPQFTQICPIATTKGYIPVYEAPKNQDLATKANVLEDCQKKTALDRYIDVEDGHADI